MQKSEEKFVGNDEIRKKSAKILLGRLRERKFLKRLTAKSGKGNSDEELAVAACCGHDFFLSYQVVSGILWRVSEQKSCVDAVFQLGKFWFWGTLTV